MTDIAKLRFTLNIAETIACICAFIAWPRLKNSSWAGFPFYLFFIGVAEMFGWYLNKMGLKYAQGILYTCIVIPAEFLFFFWLYSRVFFSRRDKLVCSTGTLLFIMSLLAEMIFFRKTEFIFFSLSYTVGNFILLIIIFIYFSRLVHSSNILHFRSDLLFWISVALLIFYLCTFPLFGLKNYISKNNAAGFRIYFIAMYILNILMYLIFSLSVLWTKPRSTYS